MIDPELLDEDFRAALKEMVGFIDISEQDLLEVYKLALEHARKRIRGRILVEQVMTRNVISVKPETQPREAEALLFENRISGIPVVDPGNRVMGVLSEKDFLYCMEDRDFMSLADRFRHYLHRKEYKRKSECGKVEDMMTAPAVTVQKEMSINRVATLLVEKKINRVPVVDKEGKLIGIVSRADLVRALHDEHQTRKKG